jgi:hypothetical protein
MPGFVFLLLVLAASAFAAPLDCVPGTIADYAALGSEGCLIGTKQVSGFAIPPLPGFGEEIPSESILVTPLLTPMNEGLRFTYSQTADAARILESLVMFQVAVSSGLIGQATLSITETTATGDSVVTATSDVCSGSFDNFVCSGPVLSLATFAIGGDSLTNIRGSFAAVPGLSVLLDAVADAGLSGSATLGSAELRFQTIPEPATFTTVGCMVAAVLVLRRYSRRPNG